jgi:hypothetical protein
MHATMGSHPWVSLVEGASRILLKEERKWHRGAAINRAVVIPVAFRQRKASIGYNWRAMSVPAEGAARDSSDDVAIFESFDDELGHVN